MRHLLSATDVPGVLLDSEQVKGQTHPSMALPTKVRLVKAMVFPVVMYGCESWTIKKAEC